MRSVRYGRERDRGASLVEFALVMPILFLILFGIIEFGAAYNDYQSIRQGAREGARDAVVATYGSSSGCSLNGPAASLSGPTGTNTQKVMCAVKQEVGLTNSRVRVRVIFTDSDTGTPSYASDRVKVCVVSMVDGITGFLDPFIDNRPMRTEIEMRAEKELDIQSSQETDPSGASWSWC